MKKILLATILMLLFVALNSTIFAEVKTYAEEANAALLAISVVIGTVIGIWYQITADRKKSTIKDDLAKAAVPLIEEAKDSPLTIYNRLKYPPEVNLVRNPNEAKNKIVAQALLETEPKKTKKFGLKDIVSAGGFVADVYSTIKPLIKKIGG